MTTLYILGFILLLTITMDATWSVKNNNKIKL